jgi:hypothetical protein
MVTIRWTDEVTYPEAQVRYYSDPSMPDSPFIAACREWVAANPPTSRREASCDTWTTIR